MLFYSIVCVSTYSLYAAYAGSEANRTEEFALTVAFRFSMLKNKKTLLNSLIYKEFSKGVIPVKFSR